MRKPYIKPTLTAFTLSGNEMLCGSCISKVKDDPVLQSIFDLGGVGNNDGVAGLSRTDFDFLFGFSEVECKNLTQFGGYCKFTSADSGMTQVAWS